MIFRCRIVTAGAVVCITVEVEVVTLAREPELAVVLLVLNDVHQIGEHLPAIATNQNVGAA